MVAANLAYVRVRTAADGQANVRVVLLEKMRCDRMPELVASDRDLVPLRVLHGYGQPGLDVAHGLADVFPGE